MTISCSIERGGRATHAPPRLVCGLCEQPAEPLAWRCAACGGPLEIASMPHFSADALRQDGGLWRYGAMLPVQQRISLGEGGTPLIHARLRGAGFLAKLEFLAPTASYKDRGTAVLLSHLLGQGVRAVVEDSSGNAGASLAAYAAAAGLQARVYVPAHASDAKRRQIACFGAELRRIEGPRSATTAACEQAADAERLVYASHAWSPFCIAGHMTCAWEIWEQLGRRAPDALVCPVGQGNLFLGLARGFAALRQAGLIARLPRMYAAQAAACAPLAHAWAAGREQPRPAEEQATIAEGIRIAAPIRGREVLRAIRATGGAALALPEAEIAAAQAELQRSGLLVEPTSAVAAAALPAVRELLGAAATLVVPLTGSGLKALAGT